MPLPCPPAASAGLAAAGARTRPPGKAARCWCAGAPFVDAAFLAELGQAFAYATLQWIILRDLQPAFDLLPFNQALERECAGLRDAAARCGSCLPIR